MEDDELGEIRRRRMAELQSQRGGGEGSNQDEQKKREMEQEMMKNSILTQVLDQEARARLSTLMMAKPDKAKRVEAFLCQMAQSGQISHKLGEVEFRSLLERINTVSGGAASSTKVKFQRRRVDSDEDD